MPALNDDAVVSGTLDHRFLSGFQQRDLIGLTLSIEWLPSRYRCSLDANRKWGAYSRNRKIAIDQQRRNYCSQSRFSPDDVTKRSIDCYEAFDALCHQGMVFNLISAMRDWRGHLLIPHSISRSEVATMVGVARKNVNRAGEASEGALLYSKPNAP